MIRPFRATPVLRILVAALVVAACTGDEPAMAVVRGQTYAVGPVRGLRVTERNLIYFGTIERTNVEAYFLNAEVLTIDDVDPQTLLVVRAGPVLEKDPDEPWGPYVGLWGGGEDEDLCSYIEASAVSFC